MLTSLKKLLLVAGLCALPFTASRAFDFSITVAPPLLPVYEQPPCPEDGYLWTPGYWDYADAGYYWVPGAWVLPPRVGFLWTPGYWGFDDGFYAFHTGYWGPTVGFYGGVNYGFGYGGYGYGGGLWRGDRFVYNTAVTRVNTTVIHNTYIDRTVINNRVTRARTSFNGPGGISARPNSEQRQAMNAPHLNPTPAQLSHREEASRDQGQFAAANHGRPAMAVAGQARERGVEERSDRQAGRNANGVGEGRLTGRQGRQLEDREGGLQRQANTERRANRGDGLTPDERQLAERHENRPGRQTYDERQAGRGRDYPQAGPIGRYGAEGRGQPAQAYGAERRAEAQQMQREAGRRQAQAQGQPREGGYREAQAQGQGRGQREEQKKGKHDDRQ